MRALGLAAGVADRLRGGLGLVGVARGDCDTGSGLGEAGGDSEPDTAVAPGDDGHLAGKIEQVHGTLSQVFDVGSRKHDRPRKGKLV